MTKQQKPTDEQSQNTAKDNAILVKQKRKTSTAEHGVQLFASVTSVLKLVLAIGCLLTFGWLFYFIHTMPDDAGNQSARTTNNGNGGDNEAGSGNGGIGGEIGIDMTNQHIPKATQDALEAVIASIRYKQFVWPNAETATQASGTQAESYQASLNKLQECSDYSKSSFNKLLNRGKQTNASIGQLQLDYAYGLDINHLTSQICQKQLKAKSVNKVMANYMSSSNDLRKLEWLETSKRNFDPQTAQIMAKVSSGFLVKHSPWQGLDGCTFVANANGLSGKDTNSDSDASMNANADASVDSNVKQNQQANSMNKVNTALYLCNQTEKKDSLCNYKGIRPANVPESTKDAPTIMAVDSQEVLLPPNLSMMLADLSLLQTPSGANSLQKAFDKKVYEQKSWFQKLLHKPENSISYAGVDVPVGYSSEITLDINIQNAAQKLALCATNQIPKGADKANFCAGVMSNKMNKDAKNMYEDALVRRVGVAVIDVQTQEIKALASSHSNCYARDNGDRSSASLAAQGCPELWQRINGGSKLLNHAVFANEAPGSTIKPTQALAIVRQWSNYFVDNQQGRALLARNISKSSTKSIIDHLSCQTYAGQYQDGKCSGYQALAQAASDVGFNTACDGNASHCSAMDLLFGVPDTGKDIIKRRYYASKILVDAETNQPYADFVFSRKTIDACLNKGQRTTSRVCNNAALANAIRDSWGRNNVKASPLGMASTFMHLMAAANGDSQIRGAHLVRGIWNIEQQPIYPRALNPNQLAMQAVDANSAGYKALNIKPKDAQNTLALMTDGISSGTARHSCRNTLGGCQQLRGQIFGKTGTPSYKGTRVSRVNRLCYADVAAERRNEQNSEQADKPSGVQSDAQGDIPELQDVAETNDLNAKTNKATAKSKTKNKDKRVPIFCNFRPLKWYVYATKDNNPANGKPWRYAVAVMAERNWFNAGGLKGVLDDTRDADSRAAQIGLMLYPSLQEAAKQTDAKRALSIEEMATAETVQ